MSALDRITSFDRLLAGLSLDDRLRALLEIRSVIPERLQSVAAARVLELVPSAEAVEWTGDASSNDDGTSTPYVSSLALVLANKQRIVLPVENDLDCGIDWYEGMTFGGFADADAEGAFRERLEDARHSSDIAHIDPVEQCALTQIAQSLGGCVDVRELVGALTTIAEEDPFGEAYSLGEVAAPREPSLTGA